MNPLRWSALQPRRMVHRVWGAVYNWKAVNTRFLQCWRAFMNVRQGQSRHKNSHMTTRLAIHLFNILVCGQKDTAEIEQDNVPKENAKHTAAGIPTWSPTVVLICRSTAYVWQSGRDAQFSADCGRMRLNTVSDKISTKDSANLPYSR